LKKPPEKTLFIFVEFEFEFKFKVGVGVFRKFSIVDELKSGGGLYHKNINTSLK
jgi:hypothetical protein